MIRMARVIIVVEIVVIPTSIITTTKIMLAMLRELRLLRLSLRAVTYHFENLLSAQLLHS